MLSRTKGVMKIRFQIRRCIGGACCERSAFSRNNAKFFGKSGLWNTLERAWNHFHQTGKALRTWTFSSTDPHIIDFSQFQAVKDFRREIQQKALCGNFSDLDDFKNKFSDRLDSTVHRYFRGAEGDQEASVGTSPTPPIGEKGQSVSSK